MKPLCIILPSLIGLIAFLLSSCGDRSDDGSTDASSIAPEGNPFEGTLPIDELAAHPNDPARVSKGLSMAEIIPRKAISAGQAAVAEHPGTPRFHFQLGRAYEAGKQDEKAFSCYRTAAAMGHAMADNHLGVAYAEGKGTHRDLDKAKPYFEKAVAAGIEIAKQSLNYYYFNPEDFSNPAYFEAVYRGEVKKLKVDQTELATQLFNFMTPFFKTEDCSQPISITAAQLLGQHAAMSNLGELLGGIVKSRKSNPPKRTGPIDHEGAAKQGYQEGQAFVLKMSMSADVAQRDAQLFYDRYGCSSPVAKQFFSHVEEYANNLGNPSFWNEVEKRAYSK